MGMAVDELDAGRLSWKQLRDAYAAQLGRLEHRERGASAQLIGICRELERHPPAYPELAELVRRQRDALRASRAHRRALRP